MFKKIAASVALAGAIAFSAAAPAVVSAASASDFPGIGNWSAPVNVEPQAIGNWPDPV